MAQPDNKVYIGFDLGASGGNYFILDDTTKGVLDSAYVLGGDVLVDVTQYVASVSTNRGKSREQDKFTAGNASVTLHNDSRIFDPFYADSPYAGQITPRRQVVIESNGIRQFTGYIDDWDFEYELGGKSWAVISCVDGFLQLASTELAEFTNTVQKSGERIVTILNRPEVNWATGARDIDTGYATLQADTVAVNTNALNYLQLVESTEPGMLFISKDGAVTFRDRITTPPLVDNIVFTDDGRTNGVGYDNIQVLYGSENLANRVVVTAIGGVPQKADSLDSQSTYGVQTLSLDVLLNSDADAYTLANYLVGLYDAPELRFSSLRIKLHDKDSVQQEKILGLEINEVVKIVFTPNGRGDAIEQYGIISGIKSSMGIDQHEIEFDFSSVSVFPLILDDAIYGRLGGSLPLYDNASTSYDNALVRYDGTEQFGYILAF